MANLPTINYANRDFPGYLSELSARIKETRPDLWTDFSDSNLGTLLLDLMAMEGDITSFGIDAALNESFLATCRRRESALAWARSIGYTPYTYSSAIAQAKSASVPSNFASTTATITAGSSLRGDNGLNYEVVEDIVFPAGTSSFRFTVVEGTSQQDSFTPSDMAFATYTTTKTKVADGSWSVYVGSIVSTNLWRQVPNVALYQFNSKVYDVSFDNDGRLIVRFGDGNTGAKPTDTITVVYRSCNGALGNTSANSIRGSINVVQGVGGAVPVSFVNYDETPPVLGIAQVQVGEVVGGSYVSLRVISGSLAIPPVIPGTVQLSLTDGVNTLIISDDSNGNLQISTRLGSGWALSSISNATISYGSGSFNFALATPTPSGAGATMSANYEFYSGSDPTQTDVTGAATGGTDPESLSSMRVTIPAFLRSHDYLTTVEDYNSAVLGIPGVATAFINLWQDAYKSNIIRFYVWSSESWTLRARNSVDKTQITVPYQRYAQASDAVTVNIQRYLRPRTFAPITHLIIKQMMLWLDVYLGSVGYDRTKDKDTMRSNIASAVAKVFEDSDGFSFRVSNIYDAVRNVDGVRYFTMLRVAGGNTTDDTVNFPELQGITPTNPASSTISGTLKYFPVSPGSVTLTVNQSGTKITLQDNVFYGQLTVTGGTATVLSSSINYSTGDWTITFASALASGFPINASYRDIQFDYRVDQKVDGDHIPSGSTEWLPPPLASPAYTADSTAPITAFYPVPDGKPISRANVSGSIREYARISDIVVAAASSTNIILYNDTYNYDSENPANTTPIFYNSEISSDPSTIRAINCRLLDFNLVGVV